MKFRDSRQSAAAAREKLMLRTSPTRCSFCPEPTTETVLAHALIRSLPENETFGGQLRIVECGRCGLRYLNPMPDPRDLGEIYNYDVYEDSTNNNPVLMEHFHAAMAQHCSRLHKVLEIGCGTGEFLKYLEDKGLECTGVEFADSSKRVKFAGRLLVGRMEDIDISDASFDAVLLLNVIEHLGDPLAVLQKIRRMLPTGGVLLLRHPNSDLFFWPPYKLGVELPKYLVHRWLRWRGKRTGFTIVGFQNQHLFYFRRRSVEAMLTQAGFSIAHFSTADPYNQLRITKSLKRGQVVQAGIATLRHTLASIGLGPECLTVAIAK